MPFKPGKLRDIYHGELADVQEALSNRSPPVHFAAGMTRILRWFAALPESEKTRILNTDPDPAERYAVRQIPTRREKPAASRSKASRPPLQVRTRDRNFRGGDPPDNPAAGDQDSLTKK